MSLKFNPITATLDLVNDTGAFTANLDGGNPSSNYISSQVVSGGTP